MITLANAKFLLFVALCFGPQVGPKHATSVEISNKSEYCVWTRKPEGWELEQLNRISNRWPLNGTTIMEAEYDHYGKVNPQVAQEISHHDWSRSSIL